MTERPILFMDEMVSAIREDRKTVTRRVGPTWARAKAGDRLWVREAWNVGEWAGGEGARSWFEPSHAIPRWKPVDAEVIYREDGFPALADVPRYRPSIHMPRWACRILLDVVSVTEQLGASTGDVESLLPDVDDAEAQREGFATRRAFVLAWLGMHPDYVGPVYRVEFRVVP